MIRRLRLDRSGASAVEFALVLPLLLLFIFGIIDAGRYLWEVNKAEKATQVGARMAVVTNIVSPAIAATNYVGVSGLTQGDLVPASALGTVTCSRTSCSCTGTCPSGYATTSTAAFDLIVTRMQKMKRDIVAANVRVTYRGSGLGYAGDPNGMDISPLVTVTLTGMTFKPAVGLMLRNVTLPDFRTTLTAEDSAGTVSKCGKV